MWRWSDQGQKTATELASEYEVHVSQLNTWKKQALEALLEAFGRGQRRDEEQRDRLYRQIGKLRVEVDWLIESLLSEHGVGRRLAVLRRVRP